MKNVLITGSNRGIGKAMTHQFADAGWKVWMGMRNPQPQEQQTQDKELLFPVALDVLDDRTLQKAAENIEATDGRLDVLINNAGIIDHHSLLDSTLQSIQTIMDTNFYGPFRTIHAMLPLLLKSDDPRVINVSSGMGAIADLHSGNAGYRLSKAGLNAQTILWSKDLESKGVRVNAMCPGWVRTDMGGAGAPRTPQEGADTAFWLATDGSVPTGKFFRDRKEIPW